MAKMLFSDNHILCLPGVCCINSEEQTVDFFAIDKIYINRLEPYVISHMGYDRLFWVRQKVLFDNLKFLKTKFIDIVLVITLI